MPSPRDDRAVFQPVVVRSTWFAVSIVFLAACALTGPLLFVYDAYGLSTLTYRVRPDGLEVRYGWLDLRIPASEIEGVRLLKDPGPLRRLEGVGLPEVQRGWWAMAGGERVYRLTTASRDLVVLETAQDASVARPGTRYLFSPERPAEFVALVEALRRGMEKAPGPGAEGAVFRPAAKPGAHAASNPVHLLLLGEGVIVGALPILLCRGRRSLRYAVGADGIVIRHLFGEHFFGWQAIRGVRRVHPPLRGVRLVGAALPGYYAGRFHFRGLGAASVFATDLRRGPVVVLERRPAGCVVLSPGDVDGFLAAVNRYRQR